MHSILVLLTTTCLETHQVHSTFRFKFARSTQSAVMGKTNYPPIVSNVLILFYSSHLRQTRRLKQPYAVELWHAGILIG